MLKTRTRNAQRAPRRERRGISLVEIVVAMTLLVVVVGSLGLLSAKNARRASALDANSERTFVLAQQANRFSVLPYDSIPTYIGSAGTVKIDTLIVSRYKFLRRVSYTQAVTGSEYRTIKVIIVPLADQRKTDSLLFQRAKTYAKSPLFT